MRSARSVGLALVEAAATIVPVALPWLAIEVTLLVRSPSLET